MLIQVVVREEASTGVRNMCGNWNITTVVNNFKAELLKNKKNNIIGEVNEMSRRCDDFQGRANVEESSNGMGLSQWRNVEELEGCTECSLYERK